MNHIFYTIRAGFSDFVPDCMIIHLFLVGWVMYFFVRFLCRFYLTNTDDDVYKEQQRLKGGTAGDEKYDRDYYKSREIDCERDVRELFSRKHDLFSVSLRRFLWKIKESVSSRPC